MAKPSLSPYIPSVIDLSIKTGLVDCLNFEDLRAVKRSTTISNNLKKGQKNKPSPLQFKKQANLLNINFHGLVEYALFLCPMRHATGLREHYQFVLEYPKLSL